MWVGSGRRRIRWWGGSFVAPRKEEISWEMYSYWRLLKLPIVIIEDDSILGEFGLEFLDKEPVIRGRLLLHKIVILLVLT